MVEMRSWRIRSSRAWRMDCAHVVERAGEAAHLVLARHVHFDGVVLARHFGGGAVELLDRLDDAARQQVRQDEAGRRWRSSQSRMMLVYRLAMRARAPSNERRMQISPTGCPAEVEQRLSRTARIRMTPSLTRCDLRCLRGRLSHHRRGGARIQGGGDDALRA